MAGLCRVWTVLIFSYCFQKLFVQDNFPFDIKILVHIFKCPSFIIVFLKASVLHPRGNWCLCEVIHPRFGCVRNGSERKLMKIFSVNLTSIKVRLWSGRVTINLGNGRCKMISMDAKCMFDLCLEDLLLLAPSFV